MRLNAILTIVCVGMISCGNHSTHVQRSSAMEPTIKANQLVEVRSMQPEAIQRWDIVVLELPHSPGALSALRVIGLPGEQVHLTNGQILINNLAISNRISIAYGRPRQPGTPEPRYGCASPYSIAEDTIFVLGDNVDNALDSRYFGGVPLESIIGKVVNIR
jgi:signal peptidase I